MGQTRLSRSRPLRGSLLAKTGHPSWRLALHLSQDADQRREPDATAIERHSGRPAVQGGVKPDGIVAGLDRLESIGYRFNHCHSP
jgi:hypothetical protein